MQPEGGCILRGVDYSERECSYQVGVDLFFLSCPLMIFVFPAAAVVICDWGRVKVGLVLCSVGLK